MAYLVCRNFAATISDVKPDAANAAHVVGRRALAAALQPRVERLGRAGVAALPGAPSVPTLRAILDDKWQWSASRGPDTLKKLDNVFEAGEGYAYALYKGRPWPLPGPGQSLPGSVVGRPGDEDQNAAEDVGGVRQSDPHHLEGSGGGGTLMASEREELAEIATLIAGAAAAIAVAAERMTKMATGSD